MRRPVATTSSCFQTTPATRSCPRRSCGARGRNQSRDLGLRRSRPAKAKTCSWPRSTSTRPVRCMAEMALSILGEDGGQFAILSASPDAANQNSWIAAMETALEDPKYANLELLEIVYGDDQSEKSYEQAQALLSKYPDMELIMAPTSVGIVARRRRRCRTKGCARRSKSPGWACRRRCSSTPRTAARRSSPRGASSTSAI